MASINSDILSPGMDIISFHLRDPYGNEYNEQSLKGNRGLLVVFTCNHCPYAKAIWPRFIKLADEIFKKGINSVAINPNIHPDYPDDSPEKMKDAIKELGINFPYLIDETQHVAKAFQAQCTPDIYLYNEELRLFYHGRFDDNWQNPDLVKKEDLSGAVELLLSQSNPPAEQNPSIGCSIKWK